jgi:Family of unknown function (DUF6279)
MITTLSAMQLSFLKSRIIGALLAAVVALSGCSTLRLAYNTAPELAYLWLDNLIDFNEEQTQQVRDSLAAWFKWNRTTQLGDYAALLARIQSQMPEPLTPQITCRWWDELGERLKIGYEQAVPVASELLLSLSPSQLQHLERRYAKRDAEYRTEYLQASQKERHEAQVKRIVERAESVYGRLDDAQRERIASAVATSPFDAELWLAERKARQRDIVQTFSRLQTDRNAPREARLAAAQDVLRALARRFEHSPRPLYRAYQERLSQYNCALAAQVHDLTTAAQRQAAVARLKSWESDLRALAAER